MRVAQLILGSLLLAALSDCNPKGPAQYQKQTEYGTYKFGYDTGDHFRQEHRGFDGVVHGRYGYKDADGKLRYVEYSAGPFGYRVKGDTGADDVPLAPSKTYKAPTDRELTDLEGGLAEIKRQQLFGVPVQPYVKGYHQDAPPPQQVEEIIVQKPIPPPLPPPPPPRIEQQVILSPPVKQVILTPPPARIEQVIVSQPKTVIHTPPVHVEQVKSVYVPPIVQQVIVPPKSQIRVAPPKQQIFQQPVVDHVTKGYTYTPAPVQVVVHKPVVQYPVNSVYVKGDPSPQVVKVVAHPRPEIFRQPVTPYVKGYVATPPPVVRVVPPTKVQIFERPVTPYTKGYVVTPTPRVVVISRPREQVAYTKGHVKSPPRVVVVKQHPQPVKVYVPPRRIVATSRPKIFEQPVQPYVKGYVQPQTKNPNRRAQPCARCRGQGSRGTFPQSVAREYVFNGPIQQYGTKGKGYNPPRQSRKGQTYRRVQPDSSGNNGLVWIPAPNHRYRDNSEYYEPPPAHAYAPY